ncbi:Leucine rich repeat/Leucine Rich repeat, putative [Angomonas deanei]|uniref:Leucine rich repeat/Leucine Rich repeat, putative n=1 Tax=Angomonas deanei TaxID=59799 RepID=A0A7G2C356_9TRYP|nr:Leucine rich repeat/Leucine Rich repeat, putative [Angomonas deanei]
MSGTVISDYTTEFVSSIYVSTGVLAGTAGALCGGMYQTLKLVTCSVVDNRETYRLKVNVTSTDKGTGRLVGDVPTKGTDDSLYIRYIKLDDPNEHISDTLDKLLGAKYDNLEELRLYAKGVSGTLPGATTSLPLTVLIVHGSLTGTIPSRYQNVKTLDLFNNSISTFDANGFTQLDIVNLSHNTVGTLLSFWGFQSTPRSFRTVDLSHNLLKSVGEGKVIKATSLTFLNISYNQVTQVMSKDWISGVTTLRTLDMSNNQFSGTIAGDYFATNMEVLNISNNMFGKTVPVFNKYMTEFRAKNNRFTTLGDSIAALTSAVVIDLSDNRDLAGGAVLGDSAIPYARELHLDNTALRVHVSKQFWANTKLENFTAANVGSVVFHDVDEGAALPNELPASLEYLDLTNAGLTGTLPEALGTFSNNLKSLKLGGNKFTGCIADAYRNHAALRRAAEQLVKDQGLQYCSPGGAAAEKGDNSWKAWKGPLVGGLVGGVLLIIVVGVLIWRYCFGCGCWCNCCGFKRYVFSRDWRTRHWNIRKKMIKCCARLLCCKMGEVATPLPPFGAFSPPDKPRVSLETFPGSLEGQLSFSSVSDTSEGSVTSTEKSNDVAVPMENPRVEKDATRPQMRDSAKKSAKDPRLSANYRELYGYVNPQRAN